MKPFLRAEPGTAPDYRMPIEVFYEDTDLSGVVYHANYLKYFERARTRWVRSLGLDQQRMLEDYHLAFTVADLKIRFVRPVQLEQELEATLAVTLRRGAQMRFHQCLQAPGDSTKLFAEADVRVACFDTRSHRPVALPTELMHPRSGELPE